MDCPNCEAEIPVEGGFELFGETVVCPECGCRCVCEGDYTDGENWGFWLIEAPDWVDEQKNKDKPGRDL
ncbi:MAG: hypothetical protein ABIK89_19005 [Planctomycetota bacterium]